jgi:small subunit ribosomal protein S15
MPLPLDKTADVVAEYKVHESDTGSPDVQIALMSARISQLTEHLKVNKKDHHSRRGMFLLIGRRKRMLAYLAKTDIERYRSLCQRLAIRTKI